MSSQKPSTPNQSTESIANKKPQVDMVADAILDAYFKFYVASLMEHVLSDRDLKQQDDIKSRQQGLGKPPSPTPAKKTTNRRTPAKKKQNIIITNEEKEGNGYIITVSQPITPQQNQNN